MYEYVWDHALARIGEDRIPWHTGIGGWIPIYSTSLHTTHKLFQTHIHTRLQSDSPVQSNTYAKSREKYKYRKWLIFCRMWQWVGHARVLDLVDIARGQTATVEERIEAIIILLISGFGDADPELAKITL